ncbi:V-set and immunoglobulin domain-containing protein 1 isoform X1 [Pogona vitticeps]
MMLRTVIIVILAAMTGPVSCAVVTASRQILNTTVGGTVSIPCMYNMPVSVNDLIIQWSFYSVKYKNLSSIYIYNQGRPYTSAAYKGRIEFANSTGNASITIFNMQPWETGVYTCEVMETTLEGNPVPPFEKSISVNVLAPPSRPLCSFLRENQKIELGHLITLSCLSEVGLPNPTYHWTRLSGDTVKPVTEAYDPQNGLLVMGNLTKLEEGYYQCTAANFLGNSTCHIDLTVKYSEAGVIIGALIGAILAAALIVGVVWFFASKEMKKKREEKAREMQVVTQKQPLNAEYTAVPSQESGPVSQVPPSKDSNETNEYATPEEMAGNEAQETGDQQVD